MSGRPAGAERLFSKDRQASRDRRLANTLDLDRWEGDADCIKTEIEPPFHVNQYRHSRFLLQLCRTIRIRYKQPSDRNARNISERWKLHVAAESQARDADPNRERLVVSPHLMIRGSGSGTIKAPL
jgi:hypothetical protein